mmetsp:Transcript_103244/g.266899  ORF Transcript_103244/g.266899 Transcript_103244/m.266899 type:complete len:270 (-) Transcript_103244:413-1222(-)
MDVAGGPSPGGPQAPSPGEPARRAERTGLRFDALRCTGGQARRRACGPRRDRRHEDAQHDGQGAHAELSGLAACARGDCACDAQVQRVGRAPRGHPGPGPGALGAGDARQRRGRRGGDDPEMPQSRHHRRGSDCGGDGRSYGARLSAGLGRRHPRVPDLACQSRPPGGPPRRGARGHALGPPAHGTPLRDAEHAAAGLRTGGPRARAVRRWRFGNGRGAARRHARQRVEGDAVGTSAAPAVLHAGCFKRSPRRRAAGRGSRMPRRERAP